MFCPRCGQAAKDDDRFCFSCGQDLAPYRAPRFRPAAASQPAPYVPGLRPHVPSHLAWAIVTLVLFFWPTGIPAVVYASKVENQLARGDVAGAQESSGKAKMWAWISFGIGVALWVFIVLGWILALFAIDSGGWDYY